MMVTGVLKFLYEISFSLSFLVMYHLGYLALESPATFFGMGLGELVILNNAKMCI